MEAVPRLPMISFELKISPDPVNLGPTLKKIIQSQYNENPEDYSAQCTELDQLRVNATTRLPRDFMGCSTLKKYYSQLNFVRSRFPIKESHSIEFVWEDMYTGETLRHNDVRFEQACVLYNIGALHSILGAIDTRQNAEGMKVSCTHFQCAAWAFQHVKDQYASVLTEDTMYDLLSFQSCLMLAQAQECILEKSMADNRKNIITAKIASQIADYYKQAIKHLSSCSAADTVGSRQVRDWKRKMDIKLHFYQCVMYFYVGNQSEEQQKWGERLCYLQAAVDKLNECFKISKSDDGLEEMLKFTMDVVVGKFNAAKKDNDFVYHDKVPALDSMPEIKGASLVKGIPFNPDDPEVAGPDIFSKLVPMEVHEASSLYSEEKAKMLRRISCEVEEKNNELTQFMASLQLDQQTLHPEESEQLPDALLEKCAKLSVRPSAIKDLVSAMQDLSGVALDVELGIRDIRTMLDEENKNEVDFQNKYGKRPILPRLLEIPKEVEKLEQAREKASQSNIALHEVMDRHLQSLRLMSEQQVDKLKAALPSVQQVKTDENEIVLKDMQRLMSKVEEMQSQRQSFEEQLRKQILSDDITSRIVTNDDGSTEALFQEELKKHGNLANILERNLAAQANILKALTDSNAKFAPVRKQINQIKAQRLAKIDELIKACDVYEDLLLKSKKGVDFFKKLEQNVITLREKTQSSVTSNQEERTMIINRHKPKEAPPKRPAAPKPSQASPSAPEQAAYEPPKLKDYLPFMKGGKLIKDDATMADPGPDPSDPLGGLDPSLLKGMDPSVLAMMQKYSGGGVGGNIDQPQTGYTPSTQPVSSTLPSSYLPTSQPESPVPERPTLRSYLQNRNINVPSVPPASNDVPFTGDLTSLPQSYQAASSAMNYYPTSINTVPSSQTSMGQGNFGASSAGMTLPTHPQQQQQSNVEQGQGNLHTVDSIHRPITSPGQSTAPGHNAWDASHGYPTPARQGQNVIQPMQGVNAQPNPPRSTGNHSGIAAGSRGASLYQPTPPVATSQPYSQQGNIHQTEGTGTGHVHAGVGQPPSSQYTPHQTLPQNNYVNHPAQSYSADSRSSYAQSTSVAGQSGQTNMYQGQTVQQNVPLRQDLSVGGQNQQVAPQSVAGIPQSAMIPQSTGIPQTSTGNPQYGGASTGIPQASFGQYPAHQNAVYGTSVAQNVVGQQSPQHRAGTWSHGTQQQQQQPMQQQHTKQHQQQQQPTQQWPMQQQPTQQQQQQQPTQQPTQQQQQMIQQQQQFLYSQQGSGLQPLSRQQNLQQQVGQNQNQSPLQPSKSTVSQQPTHSYGQNQYQPPTSNIGQQSSTSYGQSGYQPPTSNIGQQSSTSYGQSGYQPPTSNIGQQSSTSYGQSGYQPPTSNIGQQSVASYSQNQHQPPGLGQPPSTYSQNQYQKPTSSIGQQPTPAYSQNQYQPPMSNIGQQQSTNSYGQNQHQQSTVFAGQHVPTPNQNQYQPSSTAVGAQPSSPYRRNQQQQQHTNSFGQQPVQPSYQKQYSPAPSQVDGSMASSQQFQQGQGISPMEPGYQPGYSQQQPQVAVTGQLHGIIQSQQGYQPSPSPPVPPSTPPVQPHNIHPSEPGSQPLSLGSVHGQQQGSLSDQPPANQASFSQQSYGSMQQGFVNIQPRQQWNVSEQNVLNRSTPSPGKVVPPAGVTENAMDRNFKRSSASPSPAASPAHVPSKVSAPRVGPSHVSAADSLASLKIDIDASTMADSHQSPQLSSQTSTEDKLGKDPFEDIQFLRRFVTDAEKFEKTVDGLCKNTLSGPTHLENEWKEIQDEQDKVSRKLKMAIARCYSMKNRHPDVMPYDEKRVILTLNRDDYINASHIGNITTAGPNVIATQAPLPQTYSEFWLMVYEQGVEVVAMLMSHQEATVQNCVYYPSEKGPVSHGVMEINLQNIKSNNIFTERIINLTYKPTKQTRTVVHLQFNAWPVDTLPDTPAQLLLFIGEVHYYHQQQRVLTKPIVVHCSNGVGRTGIFCVAYAGVHEINTGKGIIDIPKTVSSLRQQRKFMVQDKDQLKFCYKTVLYYAKDLLMKRGILTNKASFGDRLPSPGEKHAGKPSEDFITGTLGNLYTIQHSVSKMGFGTKSVKQDIKSEEVKCDPDSAGQLSNGKPSSVTQPEKMSFAPEQKKTNDAMKNVIAGPIIQQNKTLPTNVIPEPVPTNTAVVDSTVLPKSTLGDDSVVQSLLDLQHPSTFKLDDDTKPKRITRNDFLNQSGGIRESLKDPTDPLSMLDPLWTVKKK